MTVYTAIEKPIPTLDRERFFLKSKQFERLVLPSPNLRAVAYALNQKRASDVKTLILLTAMIAGASAAQDDPVVANSVRQGHTLVTTTARGVYTTEIQRTGPTSSTSQTRFQGNGPQGFAARSEYKPMGH